LYGGTHGYFSDYAPLNGLSTSFVDPTDPKNVEIAIQPDTRMVWLESPSNPLLQLCDIRAIAELLRRQSQKIIFVFDNTIATPLFQKPLTMGVDIVFHSLTKYLNGLGDVTMGGAFTNDPEIGRRLRGMQRSLGAVPSPFDCYLVSRGLQTFELRMRAHHENGLKVAKFLEGHPKVRRVLHPGLESHPQHELSLRQCTGYSGMVSFFLAIDAAGDQTEFRSSLRRFLNSFERISQAVSFGSTHSLISIPVLLSHSNVSADHCAKIGLDQSLVRLSVGIEPTQVLIDDLKLALCAL